MVYVGTCFSQFAHNFMFNMVPKQDAEGCTRFLGLWGRLMSPMEKIHC